MLTLSSVLLFLIAQNIMSPPLVTHACSATFPPPHLQVVCQETYRTLFGRRGEAQDRFDLKSGDTAEGFDGRSDGVVGTIDAFVIPRPAKYVPDWTAYGNGDHDTSGNAHHDISQQRESASRQTTGRDVVRALMNWG